MGGARPGGRRWSESESTRVSSRRAARPARGIQTVGLAPSKGVRKSPSEYLLTRQWCWAVSESSWKQWCHSGETARKAVKSHKTAVTLAIRQRKFRSFDAPLRLTM